MSGFMPMLKTKLLLLSSKKYTLGVGLEHMEQLKFWTSYLPSHYITTAKKQYIYTHIYVK